MSVSDYVSVARGLRAAGHAPAEIREIIQEKYGEVAADMAINEVFADLSGEAGEILADTVGAVVDDVVDVVGDTVGVVGDVVGSIFDW